MSGEIELLPSLTLSKVVGVDANGLAGVGALAQILAGGAVISNEGSWNDGIWTNVYATNGQKKFTLTRAANYIRAVYAFSAGTGDTVPAQGASLRAGCERTIGGTIVRCFFRGKING